MVKNKGKNKTKFQPKVTPKPVVTRATMSEAAKTLDEVNQTLDAIPKDEVSVSEISAAYVTEGSVSPENVEKCVSDLKKLQNVLKSAQQRYEELKRQLEEDRKQWKADKAEEEKKLEEAKKLADVELKKVQRELALKRKELNDRELKLIEDEEASKAGDHSVVIERLINFFREKKEEVVATTEGFFEGQAEITKEYLQKLQFVTTKEMKLEIKEKEISTLEKKVKLLDSFLENERISMRKEVEDDVKETYENKIGSISEDAARYKDKLSKAEVKVKQLRDELSVIRAAFGDVSPREMALACNKLKAEINSLQQELASRPQQNDLDTKQKEINLLSQNLIELREKFNDKEYYDLKAMFYNNDVLIRDKQLLVDKIESAKAREITLRDTIDDLRRTITEINETHSKANAFKVSCKYDQGEYQEPLTEGTAPSCLSDFISYLQSFMASPNNGDKELKYSKDTIKKFIAGLHMSPITILQGISGTGKTSLPRAVAMAMTAGDSRYGAENGEDELPKASYRICPIQSGWRDKMDLMGFYNSFEKSYHETEFFNALYLANQPKYKESLFFIVLDEMNLSRPEHYFADFLSKLEQPEDQRKVKIDNVPEDICPKSIIGGTLLIPKNVRFIGTANHDETTLEFAPKTYDRSNVIDMPRNCPKEEIPDFTKRYNVTYKWLEKKFKEAEDKHKDECKKFDNFLKDDKLLDLLAERGIGIGNRFEGQAKRFLSVFIEAGENKQDDTAKAADHLMTTRLLRTLKDNYDISYDALDNFKECYKTVFMNYFVKEPKEAIKLIDNELDKKK